MAFSVYTSCRHCRNRVSVPADRPISSRIWERIIDIFATCPFSLEPHIALRRPALVGPFRDANHSLRIVYCHSPALLLQQRVAQQVAHHSLPISSTASSAMVATNGTNGTSHLTDFNKMFFTPVIPFNEDDTIDYDCYRKFIRSFSQSGERSLKRPR